MTFLPRRGSPGAVVAPTATPTSSHDCVVFRVVARAEEAVSSWRLGVPADQTVILFVVIHAAMNGLVEAVTSAMSVSHA